MFPKFQRWLRYFYQVPWCVPAWGWDEFKATARCILTGHVDEGPYPQAFTDAVKDYLGLQFALPMNRGRVAVELAIRAIGLDHRNEVVLPSFLCHTVLEAVLRAGAKPVFADIGPNLHVTKETVKAAITARTRCVIVPHLFGNIAPIDAIEKMLKESGIALIDDAAQSFGSRCAGRLVGTFGDCGIVSCGPGKSLAGDGGGLLVTNDRMLYERAAAISLARESSLAAVKRVLSFWIWRRFRKYTLPFQVIINRTLGEEKEPPYVACTISNLEAGIALQQFNAMNQNSRTRRNHAEILQRALGTLASHIVSDFSESCTLVKLVLVLPDGHPTSDEIIELLAQAGIECQASYSPLHLQMKTDGGSLPSTEALWKRIVCIPVDVRFKNRRDLFSDDADKSVGVCTGR